MNIRDLPGFYEPGFIDEGELLINGGGDFHESGEFVINGVKVGDDAYEFGNYIINSKGDIIGYK